MSTIPFFTTIPINMIPPKSDITFKLVPVKNNAINTPLNANGMENMMMNG
jgi:hypothetical protein